MEPAADLPTPECTLTVFLKGLIEQGHALVSAMPLSENASETEKALREIDQRTREELAIEAPAFANGAAVWAARLTYHLAQFTVCRDIGEEQIHAICNIPCPGAKSAETIWSVDLTLRHLPRIFQLARHLSGGDPLVTQMTRIAAEWPLSSVGVADVADADITMIVEHPALARLYADRIFAEKDTARLGNVALDDALRRDVGIHRELAPALAQKLFVETNERN
ncbi:MAG TPA: hypothetical protein VI282_08620 [Verrucomicrobiae bacterium]|jgi:hypothetical protein